MIEAQARVLRTTGDAAYVEPQNASGCGSCGTDKQCGVSLLGQMFGVTAREFRALNPVGAKPGDSVVIGLQEGALLQGALIVYLLPLALLFGGALAGIVLAPAPAQQELYSIGGGAAGLLLGFAGVKLGTAQVGASRRYQPVILRKSNEMVCSVIRKER